MPLVPELGGMKLHAPSDNSLLVVGILFVVVSSLVINILLLNDSFLGTGIGEEDFGSIRVSSDGNFTEEHLVLSGNQGIILTELRALNLFSQCIIDVNSIQSGELPIDDAGGFRRVSIIPLICPELQGTG